MVACVKFKPNFYIETGPVVFNSPGWDELFTVVYDRGCEVFGGCVDAGEVVNVKVCKCGIYVGCEGVPVGSVVVRVCAFLEGCEGSV